jgi:hypothetical protein
MENQIELSEQAKEKIMGMREGEEKWIENMRVTIERIMPAEVAWNII